MRRILGAKAVWMQLPRALIGVHRCPPPGRYLLPAPAKETTRLRVPVVERHRRPSTAADRAELLGTIAGSVLAVPVLAGMGYAAWRLVHLVV